MTTITTTAVAPNELIESSWGNAVRTDLTNLNADKLELAGGTLTGQVTGITPTAAGHLTRKDYVDTVVAGLLSSSGGTVTGGSITIATSGQGIILPAGEPSAANRAARKDYVDTQVATKLALSGGTITGGSITIATSGQGINLPTGEPTAAARAARKDYVDAQVNTAVAKTGDAMTGLLSASLGVTVPSPPSNSYAANKLYVDTAVSGKVNRTGDTMSGALNIANDDVTGLATGGSIVLQFAGRIMNAVDDSGVTNLWLKRYGVPAVAVGQHYVEFLRSASNTLIGSISVASSTAVAYNTTSDPRSKVRVRDAGDVSERVRLLGQQAFRGYAVGDDGDDEWVYLSSHDVEDFFPELVDGERDGEQMQQVNFPGLVPALTAALADALDRIQALEMERAP